MLPFSYNENRGYLFALSPDRLFGYWDFDTETWQRITATSMRPVVLMLRSGGKIVRRIEIDPETKSYYFSGVIADRDYQLLVAVPENGEDRVLIETAVAQTPRNQPSLHTETVYARQEEERGLAPSPQLESEISSEAPSELFVQLFGNERPPAISEPSDAPVRSPWEVARIERREDVRCGYETGLSSANLLKRHMNSGAGLDSKGDEHA